MATAIPISFPPGVVRSSTPIGVGQRWYDSHLIRWVLGRLRPILGWEKMSLRDLGSPIRAMHIWVDSNGVERFAILCEQHLWVLEGPDVPGTGDDQLRNITPIGGIAGPSNTLTTGGFGDDAYDAGTYGTPRPSRPDLRLIGEVWRLQNWGEDLLAMASTDGRLLRWTPGPDLSEGANLAAPVPGAPVGNRTFVVTAERHVILFSMDGNTAQFGWCSQENIEDWDFLSTTNTAGFYAIEPASRIINAMAAQYSVIFWTVQGAYVIEYKALPYIYTYSYLGEHNSPISGMSPVAYAGTVMWPAADGFWRFDGSQVQPVECPILDWFQQIYDDKATRAYMGGWFNGAASELWWCFPSVGATTNDTLIVYNFQERWWSIGKLSRNCGVPGSIRGYPLMAADWAIYRHEIGHLYPDTVELPWIRSGFFGAENGTVMATTKQLLVDTDADLDAVSYQLFATKGRYKNALERTKGPKLPSARQVHHNGTTLPEHYRSGQGKIDYRISGRDFSVKMQTLGQKDWSFGQGQVLITPRGKRGGP